jgi:hypothetical protein
MAVRMTVLQLLWVKMKPSHPDIYIASTSHPDVFTFFSKGNLDLEISTSCERYNCILCKHADPFILYSFPYTARFLSYFAIVRYWLAVSQTADNGSQQWGSTVHNMFALFFVDDGLIATHTMRSGSKWQ